MEDISKQMEDEVDQCSVEKKCFENEKKQLLINNDRLLEENISCLLKIESKPINAYFKNNRVVHRDYLKVTNEHVGTLQELLEQARALKPLDENLDYASKFAERIEE
ncbi:hypothetical protein Tco_1460018, partial [Tanacetum coccineum]